MRQVSDMYMPNSPLWLRLIFRTLRRARPGYHYVGVVYYHPNDDGTFHWAVDEVAEPTSEGMVMGHVQRFVHDLIINNTALVEDRTKLLEQNHQLAHQIDDLKNTLKKVMRAK